MQGRRISAAFHPPLKADIDDMARDITIITPENIPITVELAGLGARFAAFGIDLLLQVALIIVGGVVLSIVASTGRASGAGEITDALSIVYSFAVFIGYFLLFESIWNGQTVGKRALGLRVIRDGGYPITFFAAATRNLIRIADLMPFNYAVGAISIFANPEHKRLGDLVAGTIVIKERQAHALRSFRLAAPLVAAGPGVSAAADPDPLPGAPRRPRYTGPRLPETARDPLAELSSDEIDLLRRFVSRRPDMLSDDAERLAYRLAAPLVPRLNITFIPNVPPRYADLVCVIVGTADWIAAEREASVGARL